MNTNNEYIKYILGVEFHSKDMLTNQEVLLKESFLAWYLLIEGYQNEEIDDELLTQILNRNTSCLVHSRKNDSKSLFLLGWMVSISPWFFTPLVQENDGQIWLFKAYNIDPSNLLFKWAVRDRLNLSLNQIGELETSIKEKFEYYFWDFPPFKDYFLGLLH